MFFEFMVRLMQLSGIVATILTLMLILSVLTQPQWESLRSYAKSTGWIRAITNELAWRRPHRIIPTRYEYLPRNEPPEF